MMELRQEQDIDNQHINILIELKEYLSQLHMKGFKGWEPLKKPVKFVLSSALGFLQNFSLFYEWKLENYI